MAFSLLNLFPMQAEINRQPQGGLPVSMRGSCFSSSPDPGGLVRKARLPLVVLLLLGGLSFSLPMAGAQEPVTGALETENPVEVSGIRYPNGFDPNTVGDVQGRAYGLVRPEGGPVRFRLETGKESYTILASAEWYWNDLKVDLPDGAEVRVRGSKSLGTDRKLYVVAQKVRILSTGRSLLFRDEAGRPLWRGQTAGPGGARGGFMGGGGWMGGTGGMGGWGGGMGGRRR